jgi:hypothetical protein
MTKFIKDKNTNIFDVFLTQISLRSIPFKGGLWRKGVRGNLNSFELFFIMFIVYCILNIFYYLTLVISVQIYLGENIFENISGFNFDNIMSTSPHLFIGGRGEENIINIYYYALPIIKTKPKPLATPTPFNSPNSSPPGTPKPNNASKAIAAVGVVALGWSSIIITNSASKITNNIKNSQFVSDIDWYGNLTDVFNLTGHSALENLGIAMLIF